MTGDTRVYLWHDRVLVIEQARGCEPGPHRHSHHCTEPDVVSLDLAGARQLHADLGELLGTLGTLGTPTRRRVTRLEVAVGRILTVLVVAAAAVWLAALL